MTETKSFHIFPVRKSQCPSVQLSVNSFFQFTYLQRDGSKVDRGRVSTMLYKTFVFSYDISYYAAYLEIYLII